MKTSAALFLSFAFLVQGVAFAADAGSTAGAKIKTVAYDGAADGQTQAVKTSLPGSCKDGNCALLEAKSCGAYVSARGHHGYGFGSSVAAATSKANEMCGPGNNCQVVVAQCEE